MSPTWTCCAAIEAGAVDYVPVPVVPEVLRAKVRVFAELYRKTRQLETLNAELERRVAERTAELEHYARPQKPMPTSSSASRIAPANAKPPSRRCTRCRRSRASVS